MKYTIFLQNDLDINFQGEKIQLDLEEQLDGTPNTVQNIIECMWTMSKQLDEEMFSPNATMKDNI